MHAATRQQATYAPTWTNARRDPPLASKCAATRMVHTNASADLATSWMRMGLTAGTWMNVNGARTLVSRLVQIRRAAMSARVLMGMRGEETPALVSNIMVLSFW